MQNRNDKLSEYRNFFEEFVSVLDPADQLPVKVAGYGLSEQELVGGIVDWSLQYLTQKQCPTPLQALLTQQVLQKVQQLCLKQPTECGLRATDNVYEPLKLMQSVTAIVNEICRCYLDNSLLDTLPIPTNESGLSRHACTSAKNVRRKMEDRYVILADLLTTFDVAKIGEKPDSLYCVLDGHAGHEAASYAAAHLPQYLTESSSYSTNPEAALREAFLATDRAFIEKCDAEGFRSGTTVVAALLKPLQLYVAWVGDSQALLAKDGRVMQIVVPHKPSREDERKRIEELGGFVIQYGVPRVNGQLAVSRAIGNPNHKPYVSGEPDIVNVPLDGQEDFLILASDGLWDFVTEDHIAAFVYDSVKEKTDDLDIGKKITQGLVCLAKEHGSSDNITVLLVFLRTPDQFSSRKTLLSNAVKEPLYSLSTICCQETEYSCRSAINNLEEYIGPETCIDSVDDIIEVSLHHSQVENADVDNVAESDSDDEWNYYKGNQTNHPGQAKLLNPEFTMSQLNPDAAEFVPILRSVSLQTVVVPFKEDLFDDIMAQSPRKAPSMGSEPVLKLPSDVEFECEVKLRPGETSPCNASFVDLQNNKENLGTVDHSLPNTDVSELEMIPSSPSATCMNSFRGNAEEPRNMCISMSFSQEIEDERPYKLQSEVNEDLNAVQQLPTSDSEEEYHNSKEATMNHICKIEKDLMSPVNETHSPDKLVLSFEQNNAPNKNEGNDEIYNTSLQNIISIADVDEIRHSEIRGDEIKHDEIIVDEIKPEENKPDEIKLDEIKSDLGTVASYILEKDAKNPTNSHLETLGDVQCLANAISGECNTSFKNKLDCSSDLVIEATTHSCIAGENNNVCTESFASAFQESTENQSGQCKMSQYIHCDEQIIEMNNECISEETTECCVNNTTEYKDLLNADNLNEKDSECAILLDDKVQINSSRPINKIEEAGSTKTQKKPAINKSSKTSTNTRTISKTSTNVRPAGTNNSKPSVIPLKPLVSKPNAKLGLKPLQPSTVNSSVDAPKIKVSASLATTTNKQSSMASTSRLKSVPTVPACGSYKRTSVKDTDKQVPIKKDFSSTSAPTVSHVSKTTANPTSKITSNARLLKKPSTVMTNKDKILKTSKSDCTTSSAPINLNKESSSRNTEKARLKLTPKPLSHQNTNVGNREAPKPHKKGPSEGACKVPTKPPVNISAKIKTTSKISSTKSANQPDTKCPSKQDSSSTILESNKSDSVTNRQ